MIFLERLQNGVGNAVDKADRADTVQKAAEYLTNLITLGLGETDEEKLKEKYEPKIQAKLSSGKQLTVKELQYLRRYNPALYAQAIRVAAKRRATEERLKCARSKREVQEIQYQALSSISKEDPARQYMIAAVKDAVKEFKETDGYRRLPEDTEEKNGVKITYELNAGAYQMAYVADEGEILGGFAATS